MVVSQNAYGATVRVLDADPRAGGGAGRRWRTRIGLVPQSTSLDAQLTVTEALTLFGGLYAGGCGSARFSTLSTWRTTPGPGSAR